jgi:hypothetical protein
MTPAHLAESLHANSVLSLLSFSATQISKGTSPFSFLLLQMENLMPSWHSFAQENFLLRLQGVQQPCEDPSLDSSSSSRTQRVLSSCALWHLLNALLAECLESSVILFLYELTTEFLLSTLCLCSMPSWQSSTELLRDFYVFYCVFLYTVSPPRCSTTLRSSSESMISVGVPS